MNQLRLDPLSGRWVVVSPGRSERPYSFVSRTPWVQEDSGRPCPFCAGNEETTPPALETYGPSGHWLVRVVPNLYPAFEGDEPFVVANRGPVFTQATAGGIHEILIFSPEHDATWAMLSEEQTSLVMAALRDRLEEHSQRPNLRYTQAIVNSGREAGASLEHPHGQLLGMSFIPRELAEEQARFARFVGSCLLCTTIEAEEDSGQRVIYADDRVVVICPFWSAVPYEMLVIPREHFPHLHKSPPPDLLAVGEDPDSRYPVRLPGLEPLDRSVKGRVATAQRDVVAVVVKSLGSFADKGGPEVGVGGLRLSHRLHQPQHGSGV